MADRTVADPRASSDGVRVGAVDCGTNSIRLLVADVHPDTGELADVVRRMEIVRLGQGVDRAGVLDPEAIERTLRAARSYAAQCRELGATSVRFVATSASRDARNAGDFTTGVRQTFREAFGAEVAPEVVSGDEEARLSFRGATGGLRVRGIDGPYLVVDLGGGSTEFVRGTTTVEAARSVDIGCVRMTERHHFSDPPTAEQVAAASADVDAAIDEAVGVVPLDGVQALVGLAGTVTTITAHALRLPAYDPDVIHLARVPVERIHRAAADLLAMPRRERARLPYMHPGRVDVIGAGALIWSRVVARVADTAGIAEVVTSEHDILDGIALSQVS
ncbi:MAG TPA: exopolyphosphatase [Intrasporangium sp.]|uniref:Ppx/GppA phosphatase family protein n=1 Tax=Intrasporangium sp. TaxID=1925024 RepID=UPI002D78D029|nr:exopolyphosphatase [Intrasporangium sp.]HET7400064.1 exopolyphosphatase [Intrasporangium sp.]